LHLAAASDELVAARVLLDHGADAGATDPEFHATPLVWAEFTRHDAVADLLRRRSA
jgi:ankyrin repeat protein